MTAGIDLALALVEEDLGREDVAEAEGFGTAESLRRAFGRRLGLSPREYRARFGAQGGVT